MSFRKHRFRHRSRRWWNLPIAIALICLFLRILAFHILKQFTDAWNCCRRRHLHKIIRLLFFLAIKAVQFMKIDLLILSNLYLVSRRDKTRPQAHCRRQSNMVFLCICKSCLWFWRKRLWARLLSANRSILSHAHFISAWYRFHTIIFSSLLLQWSNFAWRFQQLTPSRAECSLSACSFSFMPMSACFFKALARNELMIKTYLGNFLSECHKPSQFVALKEMTTNGIKMHCSRVHNGR